MQSLMYKTEKYTMMLKGITKDNISGFDDSFIKFIFGENDMKYIFRIDINEGSVVVFETDYKDCPISMVNYNYNLYRVAGLVNIHSSVNSSVVTSTSETDSLKDEVVNTLDFFNKNFEDVLNNELDQIYDEFYFDKTMEELKSNGIYLNKSGEMIFLSKKSIPRINLSNPSKHDTGLINEAKFNRSELKLLNTFRKQIKSSVFRKNTSRKKYSKVNEIKTS